MPIYPLEVMSEEAEAQAIAKLEPPKSIVVRYGYLKQIGEFPYDGGLVLGCGTKLIIRTTRGVEMAEMLTVTCPNSGCGSSISRSQMLQYIENSGGKQYPFSNEGKILRVATVEDLNEQSRIEAEKHKFVKAGRQIIRDLDLPMKLVDVEQLFARDRVVFYFTSENRIDFRELVRRLAAEFHVRVEMRQVGARDEARIVADYERCGQHCCCKQFLKVLKPVSMRSAKVQKATLDPSKISGRCGRLMCCLRYEDETYEELRKRLPHRNTRMMSEDGPGFVISTQILTQLVLLELESTGVRQAYPLERLERIAKDAPGGDRRDPNKPREVPQGRDKPERPRREPRRPQPGAPLRDQEVESVEGESSAELPVDETGETLPAEGQPGGGEGAPKKKRRRRRRRRRGGGGGPGGPEASGGSGDGGGDGGGGGDNASPPSEG
ncbi:MAG: hypothetical protein GC162_11790 [Planctomycetes bacterium]|nr:hypothetical protein [Planctomycetota bacterium]